MAGLLSEHGFNQPACRLCGTDHHGHSWDELLGRYVEIMVDPSTGDEFLVCRGFPQACKDGAAQRQLHLDQAAGAALGIELPRPELRLVGSNRYRPRT